MRQRKQFPPGTFIPTPARVCAIVQLCIVFTIVLWHMSQPFMGDIFTVKSKLLLYHDVIGIAPAEQISEAKKERLERNAKRFETLSEVDKREILDNFHHTQDRLQRSFFNKLFRAFENLFYLPVFEQAWLVLSLLISILLMKRVQGSQQAVWLLPLLTLCFAIDNRWNGMPATFSEEEKLFPSEKVIVEDYLKQPLSDNIFDQQEQLKRGWNLYLVKEWTSYTPSEKLNLFHLQAEEGEFFFNLERLKTHVQKKIPKSPIQQPYWLLFLYLFWNLFFTCTIWKHKNLIFLRYN